VRVRVGGELPAVVPGDDRLMTRSRFRPGAHGVDARARPGRPRARRAAL